MYPEPSRGTAEGSFLQAPASPEWHSHCRQCPWLHVCPDARAGGRAALETSAPGRRPGEGPPGDQCRSSDSLRVGQPGPCRVGLREQLPHSFPGTFHPVSHRGFAEGKPRGASCAGRSHQPGISLPLAHLCLLSSALLIRIQGSRVPGSREKATRA